MAGTPVCRAEEQPEETTLRRVSGLPVARIFTPQRVTVGGTLVQFQGARGDLNVGGKSFEVSGLCKSRRNYLAVDGNGNGKMEPQEVHALQSNGGSVLVKLNVSEEGKKTPPYLVVLEDVRLGVRGSSVMFVSFCAYPAWGMQGKVEQSSVTLIDMDMDGAFRQDGQDAVAIQSNIALPLLKVHRIGKKLYHLEVSEDGETISLKETQDEEMGQVQPMKKSPLWKSLVLSDGENKAFDVIQNGGDSVPAGTYRVMYGVLAQGEQVAFMADPPKLEYEIKSGQLNLLRVGLPVELGFSADFSDGKVAISPGSLFVVGAGEEKYRFPAPLKDAPRVHYLIGKKVVKDDKMGFG